MRKRSFLALTIFWTFYVWVVGGLALSNLESPSKCSELSKCSRSSNDTKTMCRDMEKCYDWSAVNSTFVAFTAMTTIGYGVQAPETAQGRIYTVFYTLIGIPLNLYYIATIAGYLTKFVEKILENQLPRCVDERHIQRWKFVAGVGLAFVFFVLFLLLPALGFMYWESENEWTFIDSFYFSFVTLSTIGFGDLVANNNDGKRKDLDLTFETSNLTSSTAEIVIMIWIITGLSFLMMVFNLITDFTGRVLKTSVERLRKKEAEVYEAYESTMESTTERAIMSWALSLKKASRLTDGERKDLEVLADMVAGKNVKMNEEFTSELFGAASTKIERLNDENETNQKKDSFYARIKKFFDNKERKTLTTMGSKISGDKEIP